MTHEHEPDTVAVYQSDTDEDTGLTTRTERMHTPAEAAASYLHTLTDGDYRSRRSAAESLGEIGRRHNGDLRRQILESLEFVSERDPEPYVRVAADNAIAAIREAITSARQAQYEKANIASVPAAG